MDSEVLKTRTKQNLYPSIDGIIWEEMQISGTPERAALHNIFKGEPGEVGIQNVTLWIVKGECIFVDNWSAYPETYKIIRKRRIKSTFMNEIKYI